MHAALKDISLLKSNWNSLLAQLQVNNHLGLTVFDDLVSAYGDPARRYHNLGHVAQVLELLEQTRDIADRFVVLQLSAWFHDFIYDPQRKDNEVASAIYAERILQQLNLDLEVIQSVKQIIISTKKHEPLLDSIDNLLFLDADLSILGTSPDKYLAYSRAIKQEYKYLRDRDYYLGRKQVLNSFLKRARIYYSDRFYQKFEQQARKNLTAEIKTIN